MGAQDLARVEAVVGILQDWAYWQKGNNHRLGYPSHSAGFQSGYVSSTFDEMCRTADLERCRIVDTCVDDLTDILKSAILHKYLQLRVELRDYENALALAHVELLRSFQRKGILY